VLITSWRGQPGRPDEPQHARMGLSTHALLAAIDIPHVTLEHDDCGAATKLQWAIDRAEQERRCVAIIVPDGAFEPMQVPAAMPAKPALGVHQDLTTNAEPMSRTEALEWLRALTGPNVIRVATTGKTGRELFALSDDPSNLYVVGSMGLASSVGLGMSLAVPHRTLVIDGDGAALMHLGALPMIGCYGGATFMHVVLDNGSYDSTGGQQSIANHAPFAEIAARCGYAYTAHVDDVAGLKTAMMAAIHGPALIHVRVRSGSPPALPRPSLAPHDVLQRLQTHFGIRASPA